MKKLFKPACLLLYILNILVFFLAGATFAGVTGAAKGQGLAGGAIVFGYGVLFAGVVFVLSLFVAYYAAHKTIVTSNKILFVIFVMAMGIFSYRFMSREKNKEPIKQKPKNVTEPVVMLISNKSKQPAEIPGQMDKTPMGLGFFMPDFMENKTLYFYGNLNLEKPIDDHFPYDSITFKHNENGLEIATAPPWLAPSHLKMDYGILYFRVQSIGKDFVEIAGNIHTQQSTYVSKYAGKVLYWPEFLLNVNSVEFKSGEEQPLRIKPLEHAGEVRKPFVFMNPIKIKQNWMMVELRDAGYQKVGEGWIRWERDNELLITYSLLS